MIRRSLFGLAVVVLTVAAFLFRIPNLDNRTMHGDEAVHTVKFWDLWNGHYKYDPNEFHGPTLYYATVPFMALSRVKTYSDTTEREYRIVTVAFGAALVLLLLLFYDAISMPGAIFAGLLFAFSPAFVFYSRYYIQEMLFAFFTVALIGTGWRYSRSRKTSWAVMAGLSAGLMIGTKETSALNLTALLAAAMITAFWMKRNGKQTLDVANTKATRRQIGIAAVVCIATAFVVYSSFFGNLSGPIDFFRSFTPWSHRAGGTDIHNHPWNYYLSLLIYTHYKGEPVWSEGFIVGLALVGIVAGLLGKRAGLSETQIPFVRFISLFTVILTGIYSAIPYKTPWCLLSFLAGMILLAGVGAVWIVGLVRYKPLQAVAGLLLLVGVVQLGREAYRASFELRYVANNPYTYSQTVPDVLELKRLMEALAQVSPDGYKTVIKVFSSDGYYYPLPWYLRKMRNVGYWTELPPDPSAPIVLASQQFDDELTAKLDSTHFMTGYKGLRPGVIYGLWVRSDIWTAYVNKLNKNRRPLQIGE